MTDEIIISRIERLLRKRVSAGSIRGMAALGLLDIRACERMAIEDEVADRVRRGTLKARAMEEVAGLYSCSMEKVRTIIYGRR